MKFYIVGEEDALGCTTVPPRVRTIQGKTSMLWLASDLVGRHEFPVKRGRAEEFRTYYPPHTRVIARELPEDAEAEIGRLNLAVVAAEEELKKARQERRDFLAAQVPRAQLARVPEST